MTKIGAVLSAIVLSLGLAACDTESGGETPDAEPEAAEAETGEPGEDTDEASDKLATGWTDDDIEYKLAVIDASGFVDSDDPIIADYAAALDGAEEVCPEDRTALADIVVRAVQILDEQLPSHSEDALSMLGAIAEGAEPADGVVECTEVAAALIAIMVSD